MLYFCSMKTQQYFIIYLNHHFLSPVFVMKQITFGILCLLILPFAAHAQKSPSLVEICATIRNAAVFVQYHDFRDKFQAMNS